MHSLGCFNLFSKCSHVVVHSIIGCTYFHWRALSLAIFWSNNRLPIHIVLFFQHSRLMVTMDWSSHFFSFVFPPPVSCTHHHASPLQVSRCANYLRSSIATWGCCAVVLLGCAMTLSWTAIKTLGIVKAYLKLIPCCNCCRYVIWFEIFCNQDQCSKFS